MKKIYVVHTRGYHNCPEFDTLAGAKKLLKELVDDSYRDAKRRWPTARKHKLGQNNYQITLASDRNSQLFAHHFIAVY